jgi:hypothetical protein
VSLILFLVIVWTVVSQFHWYRTFKAALAAKLFHRKSCTPVGSGEEDSDRKG